MDSNIGGEIGAEVGGQLSKLSKGRQVFCVTHLPQVAAWGNSHFLVEKTQDDDSTKVSILRLPVSGERRVAELARMLGDRRSASAIAHAKKLLAEHSQKRFS